MPAAFLTAPVPHSEGAAAIANKPVVTRAVFNALAPELQARALVITGVEVLDAVARVREMISRLPMGADYDDLKAQIEAEISPWLVTSTDPDEQAKQRAAAHRRAEMLLRMHGWQSYARTQHALMEAHTDAFPYRQYLSSEDSRVRPAHAALNRKIFPADHPFWHNHTPPWEFGCRCDCVPLTQDEVDEIRAAEAVKAPEDMEVMPAAQLREIEANGRMVKPGGQGFLDIRTPRERNGSGYEWNVKDDALSIDQILARFTPLERQTFETFAANQKLEDGRSLLEWWKNGAGSAPVAVPAAAAPIVPIAPPSQSVVPSSQTKAPAPPRGLLPKDPTERMRARIARAQFKSETALGGGINTTVKLKNGVTVVFKPASGEYTSTLRPGILPGEQYKREKASSIIDQHLGTHLVPPVEIIQWRGETGSAMIFKPGFETAHKASKTAPINIDADTARNMQLLDDVLGHLDRHAGNFMVKRSPGKPDAIAMIDNGLALSSDPVASGRKFPGKLDGKPVDAKSLKQLDALISTRTQWEPEVRNLIGQPAIDLMLQRISTLKQRGIFGLRAPMY